MSPESLAKWLELAAGQPLLVLLALLLMRQLRRQHAETMACLREIRAAAATPAPPGTLSRPPPRPRADSHG